MKTRVVRYWHETDWHYRVEQWVQATGEEEWIRLSHNSYWEAPKEGEWYWKFVRSGLALDRAEVIAQRLVNGQNDAEDPDVVAEYGA